jgi:hypothetical protein
MQIPRLEQVQTRGSYRNTRRSRAWSRLHLNLCCRGMKRQVVKPVDELVEVAAKICSEGLRPHVDEESPKVAHTICDADPRAKNECCTLRGDRPGEIERCHRARRWIFDALPYLARQLSVFNRLPTEGYAQGGKFWVRGRRDQELEGARNTKLRQVRAAKRVIPYVLYGGLYCLKCRMT